MHTKRFCEDFEIKNLSKYHDLYLQINTLLLADTFDNFWNMCPEIYELGEHEKPDLLTDINGRKLITNT